MPESRPRNDVLLEAIYAARPKGSGDIDQSSASTESASASPSRESSFTSNTSVAQSLHSVTNNPSENLGLPYKNSEPVRKPSTSALPPPEAQEQKRATMRAKQSKRCVSHLEKPSYPNNARKTPQKNPPSARDNNLATASSHQQPIAGSQDVVTSFETSEASRSNISDRDVACPAVSGVRVALPPKYCRQWQRGKCLRGRCRYIHAFEEPKDKQKPESKSTVQPPLACQTAAASSKNMIADVPKMPGTSPKKDLNGLPPGYCRKWQQGSCRKGDKCQYEHIEWPHKADQELLSVNLKAQTSGNDQPLPASHVGNIQKPSQDTKALHCVPKQRDCTFCSLGLCTNQHCTVSSLMVPGFPTGTTASDIPILTEASRSLNLSQPIENLHNLPADRSNPKISSSAVETSGLEEMTVTLLKSTRVTIGPGFQILDVMTAFESCYIILDKLPVITTESDVSTIVEPFGDILKIECWKHKTGSGAKVQFANSTQAAAAVAELNGSMHFFAKITASTDTYKGVCDVGRLNVCLVRIDIPAPGMVAYAGFETLKQAEKVVADVHGSRVKNHIVAAHLHNGLPRAGPFTVRFEGLPHQLTEKKVRALGGGKSSPEGADVLLGHIFYKSSLPDVTNVLQNILEEHGNVISFDFLASPVNGRLRGTVQFASAAGAAAACSSLNNRRFAFLGSERIYLYRLHRLTYRASPEIYNAIQPDLVRLQSFARGQPGVQITMALTGSGYNEIELSGSHLDGIKRVKAPLERMIAGEVLQEQNEPVWDNFLSTARGNSFVDTISRSTQTHILVQHIRCCVNLWGPSAGKERASRLILDRIRNIRAEKCFALPLSGKLLLRVLFDSLGSIHEEIGKDNVSIDFATHRLVIRGTEEQFLGVVSSLGKTSSYPSSHEQRDSEIPGGGSQTCPICLDTVLDGITLKCGHGACKQCFARYLVSAKTHQAFPLKCLGDDSQCRELIPLPLCKTLLEKDDFSRLIDASFSLYIKTRPQEFHYCPTPDCPQIYRATPGVVLQCPSCLASICPSCHAMQHDGEECLVTNEAGERLFRQWKDTHNVKTCPRCSASIEKVAGCNHMTCARCSTHICWACMETFQAATDVYDHMVKAHGGIGL
ncbi:hypothetical protein EW145_g3293 [Phellinidium pouzarii]|uniref:Uncharacterized protein n=1 Tax=Phellinidium pouzarii TaxID=167371 RepID=A0A4S4L7K7_9AGAM|nr:hypothetical protein EW145_g3293 [Phellinidium pouzarii]